MQPASSLALIEDPIRTKHLQIERLVQVPIRHGVEKSYLTESACPEITATWMGRSPSEFRFDSNWLPPALSIRPICSISPVAAAVQSRSMKLLLLGRRVEIVLPLRAVDESFEECTPNTEEKRRENLDVDPRRSLETGSGISGK